MDLQLKIISNLVSKLIGYMKVINDIIYEINTIVNGKKIINISIRNSLNSLNESMKKININENNNIISYTSSDNSDKDEQNIFLKNMYDKKTVIFKKFGNEQNFVYDSNTPINIVLRKYLEYSGSLKMPKKPIFLYKGSSLNPNDKRIIGDITKDELEITVDNYIK